VHTEDIKRLRVLHCPTSTGGNPQNLAQSERKLGLKSWSLVFKESNFLYSADEILFSEDTPVWKQQIKSWGLIFRAIKEFDVIHYNSGTSILPWDVPFRLYGNNFLIKYALKIYVKICRTFEQRVLRKKIIAVTYQGDDARQGDFCIKNFPICIANNVDSDYYPADLDIRKRSRIDWFDQYADLIYALNPDLLWVLPKRAVFMPYANVNIFDWAPVAKSSNERLVVLHAPSNRNVKGTAYIISAVERLKQEGVPFDFILVENIANADARKLYEQADLVVDQLLAGWYGGLAVEVMALSKPVISYLRRADFIFLPQKMREELPIIEADPSSIYSVLRDWLTLNRMDLAERGAKSRKYVENWHNPVNIARHMKSDYERTLIDKSKLRLHKVESRL
jgi:hypothetical protein